MEKTKKTKTVDGNVGCNREVLQTMIHLGCLWFADLCWPAKKGGTATSVFCLIGLLERCADEVCQEGLWGQWATVRVHVSL